MNEHQHKSGECFNRKIATLDGPCGDPRCRETLTAMLEALKDAELYLGTQYGHRPETVGACILENVRRAIRTTEGKE